jgi:protein subunit release factor A
MNLDRVMDGDMEDLIEALINEDQRKKLEASV